MDFKALLEPKKQAKKECKTGTKTVNAGEFMLLDPSPVLLVLDRLRGIKEHIIRPCHRILFVQILCHTCR